MSERRDPIEATVREFRRELTAILDQLHEDAPHDDRRSVVTGLSRSLASARAVLDRRAPQAD